ncbi:MexH family multidrug efflux RND transporter periplasmic adaptor subunit [Marivirga lumbricoides]|uniref:MexH family multidrug efflux RND transporter periplasmic adaptor subunit n=1 Tax=Marivirga lumbricoides TaxID=1046115 RepID=A0ABQ1LLW3_9BACT|nr:MexH family multidrug efflux RND transporter periplasmic adaptor subunit [Marivirga lumbricoides]
MKFKNIIIIIIIIGAIVAVAFVLKNNKTEMEADTQMAMQQSKYVPVTVEKVKSQTIDVNFESNGVFEAHQEVKVMSETNGAVVAIYKKKGDYVRKGDVLLKTNDQLIQSELTIAQLNLNQAEDNLKRFKNLIETDAITKKQYEDSERAVKISKAQLSALQKRYNDTKVTAPISGYINEDYYEPGVLVSPGMPLAEIINTNPLKLSVNVSENEVATVSKGQKVTVKANALPNQTFEGTVEFISNKADGSFKYEVIIVLEKVDNDAIRPGMFGTAKFSASGKMNTLVVNRKSISGGLKDPAVFMIENGVAKRKPVEIVPVSSSSVQVISGLNEGDEIIASGLINVKEGITVKVQ